MYDLTMTFCRAQEFYESPYKQFRNKKFKLLDYMKAYSKRNGRFTYPLDWGGFNIPGKVINNLFTLGIDDYNEYDQVIESIHNHINSRIKKENHYYLIASDNNVETIDHEVCHALFYLDKEYKKKTKTILKLLKKNVRKKAEKALKNLGYCQFVMNDELQAYLSTEFYSLKARAKFNKRELINLKNVTSEFKDHFKPYKEKLKI
jgi:hypothetical protein